MVVLSVGLNPPDDAKAWQIRSAYELDGHGSANQACHLWRPPGPGLCQRGFQGPTDIPDRFSPPAEPAPSVVSVLTTARESDQRKDLSAGKDVSEEEPRIGVFVVSTVGEYRRVVNVPEAVEYSKTLPNSSTLRKALFMRCELCQRNNRHNKEKGLNRVIVAACSPRTSNRYSGTPFGRRDLINITTTWPILENTAPGSL